MRVRKLTATFIRYAFVGWCFVVLPVLLCSCLSFSSDVHREGGEIFHAASASGGVGGIYFALYRDGSYQVCETGGVGQTCYDGMYTLTQDTITLLNLPKQSSLGHSRLVICRYADKDSTYWKWKYPQSPQQWDVLQWRDKALDNLGDVHQIDSRGQMVLDTTYYFVIRLDSLKKYNG